MGLVRPSELSPAQRDAWVVKLRGQGWTIRAIASRLGMSPKGVRYALLRVEDGRSGRDRRT